jgi:hypothetical protein
VLSLGAAAGAARPPDRLDRFRQLAATRLSLAQIIDGDTSAYQEAYALLDEEIVESLGTGGVFASPEFLQDRLDAFREAWGAAVLDVRRVGTLVVGAFTLGDGNGATSVRVYGRLREEAALLDVLERGSRARLFTLPSAPRVPAQFLVAWEGPPSGRGTRPLRVDLVRSRGDRVHTVWTTADLFPAGLEARAWVIRGPEVRIRYELHYPGWAPGCDAQTEGEDVYRLAGDTGTFVRASRQQHNAWHRDFHNAAAGMFTALAAGDRAALGAAVPDAGLRGRLPATLRPEPACDAVEGTGPDAVSIAASAADGRPWTLTFRKVGPRWRLTAADPVLQ